MRSLKVYTARISVRTGQSRCLLISLPLLFHSWLHDSSIFIQKSCSTCSFTWYPSLLIPSLIISVTGQSLTFSSHLTILHFLFSHQWLRSWSSFSSGRVTLCRMLIITPIHLTIFWSQSSRNHDWCIHSKGWEFIDKGRQNEEKLCFRGVSLKVYCLRSIFLGLLSNISVTFLIIPRHFIIANSGFLQVSSTFDQFEGSHEKSWGTCADWITRRVPCMTRSCEMLQVLFPIVLFWNDNRGWRGQENSRIIMPSVDQAAGSLTFFLCCSLVQNLKMWSTFVVAHGPNS